MTARAKKVLDDALTLGVTERSDIATKLIESLDNEEADDPKDVEAAWAAEIARRLAEIDSGKAKMIPGEQVLRMIRDRQRGKTHLRVSGRRPKRNVQSRRLVRTKR